MFTCIYREGMQRSSASISSCTHIHNIYIHVYIYIFIILYMCVYIASCMNSACSVLYKCSIGMSGI